MRALLVLLSAVFMLSACSKEVKLVSASSTQEPLQVEEQATVELRLSETDLAKYTDQDEGVWKEARKAGLLKVFNKILNRDLIIVPVDGGPLAASYGSYTQSGFLVREGDAETGDIVQSFMVSARFAGDLGQGGQIIALEEERYVSGMHDISYVMFYQNMPSALPSYVAIAEPVKELGSSFFRVVGMAEVKQLMHDTVALPKNQGGATGRLCAIEIVVSDREVEAGDRIFLMNVDVAALEPEAGLGPDGEPETVTVLPPHSDTVQEPKEKK